MEETPRKTVGAIALELMQKEAPSRDPIEIQREMQKEYLDELVKCVELNKAKIHGDFFVSVLTKNEKLMPNVFRNYFLATKACPTPTYDQSVFWYRSTAEQLEYLWTVPSKDTCIYFKKNAHLVTQEEKQLLQFVLDFYDNTLLKVSKRLNNEEEKSPFLIKG